MLLFYLLKKLYFAFFFAGFTATYPQLYRVASRILGRDLSTFATLPFDEPSVVLAALGRPAFALALAAACLPVAAAWKRLRWSELGLEPPWRAFFTLMALIVAWPLATGGWDLYLDRFQGLDRFVLAAAAGLVALHPGFAIPFLAFALVRSGQLCHPLESWTLTTSFLPLALLLLLAARLHAAALLEHRRWPLAAFCLVWGALVAALPPSLFPTGRWLFLFAALIILRFLPDESSDGAPQASSGPRQSPDRFRLPSLVFATAAACYFAAGLDKVRISPHGVEWVTAGRFVDMVAYRVSEGWLGWLSPSSQETLYGALEVVGRPLLGVSLLFELTALALLARRRPALGILAGLALMHLGIFALLGIFFWPWLVTDAALVAILLRGGRGPRGPGTLQDTGMFQDTGTLPAFGVRGLVLTVPAILAAPLWLSPPVLAWHDTPLSYHFELEAVDSAGNVFPLQPSLFDPYHGFFAAPKYVFVLDRPLPLYPQGTRDFVRAEEIRRAAEAGPEALRALVRERGVVPFDASRAQIFDDFLRTVLTNLQSRGSRPIRLRSLQPPRRNWSPPQESLKGLAGPISEVRVRLVEHFFDGRRVVILEERVVRKIVLTAGSSSASVKSNSASW